MTNYDAYTLLQIMLEKPISNTLYTKLSTLLSSTHYTVEWYGKIKTAAEVGIFEFKNISFTEKQWNKLVVDVPVQVMIDVGLVDIASEAQTIQTLRGRITEIPTFYQMV